MVERLRELYLELHLWYLDVGILVGTTAAIKAALALLKELLPLRGLELNTSKCKLFGPGLRRWRRRLGRPRTRL